MLVNQLVHGGIRAIIDADNTVFDNIVVPTGVDKDLLIDHIIYKYGDAPLMYPDPAVIKYYIGKWATRRLPLWVKYKAAIELQYNPIENYNRTEHHTEELYHSKSNTGTQDLDKTGTIDLDKTGTVDLDKTGTIDIDKTGDDTLEFLGTTKVETDNETLTDISAFNSGSYDPKDRVTLDGEQNTSFTNRKDKTTYNTNDETTFNTNDETTFDTNDKQTFNTNEQRTDNLTESGNHFLTIDSNISGNIGTTTTQEMLAAQLNLIPSFDIIDYIADDWHSEFNLLFY